MLFMFENRKKYAYQNIYQSKIIFSSLMKMTSNARDITIIVIIIMVTDDTNQLLL